MKNLIESLFTCAKNNNFEFNLEKLKSNFKMEKFKVEKENNQFRWIGKIINLETMELFHT